MIIESQMTWAQGCIRLSAATYSNGRMALLASDPTTGAPIAKLTVNVPHVDLAPGEIILKDWSENEGAYETLEAAGLVELTGRSVICGFELAEICRWLGGEL